MIKNEIAVEQLQTKPFLRWAGGKTWLLKHLSAVKTLNYKNYHEPFFGGGAVYFNLSPANNSFLSDLNPTLIETYQAVKEDVDSVIEILKTFNNTQENYYLIRGSEYKDVFQRAAKFIYLNQTSYNGIHRVNLQGKFNVPYGFRKKPFLDEVALRKASKSLSNATLIHQDFFDSLDHLSKGDLVFLDPPYTVSHNENGFIKYNEKIFSLDDQIRLSRYIDQVKEKEAYYILTNAAHKTIIEIFGKGDRRLEFSRASTIGGKNAQRGSTKEYIFTNIEL
ncbi:Dam family site-specific DNA-(adenine-N6)-methyltransferase [Sphingobacterium multivorum]|uniref:DNA adenine methylase n=1 Tax=Sphingobacterium multivorum TaxID=28454 RepID=UPI003015F67B